MNIPLLDFVRRSGLLQTVLPCSALMLLGVTQLSISLAQYIRNAGRRIGHLRRTYYRVKSLDLLVIAGGGQLSTMGQFLVAPL